MATIKVKGSIKWGINIFLLIITGGLWIFAFPWWPRHSVALLGGLGASATATNQTVVNVHQAPAQQMANTPHDELRQLKELHVSGLLTAEEYETRRVQLVAKLGGGQALPPPSSR
jgi:hypothetical protein